MVHKVLPVEKFTFNKDTRTFSADASDLGLPVGVWPEKITLRNEQGLEADFYFREDLRFHGEFAGMEYANASTLSVKIFND